MKYVTMSSFHMASYPLCEFLFTKRGETRNGSRPWS